MTKIVSLAEYKSKTRRERLWDRMWLPIALLGVCVVLLIPGACVYMLRFH